MPAPRVPIARLENGENAEKGRQARTTTALSSHGEWTPAADRPDPVAILRRQAESRVQELLPIRYGRMAASPFTFYRGDGRRPRSDPGFRPRRPSLRRCPYLQLRWFRRARPAPRLRAQRLRRGATGAMGVGRQADGGEHRDRRPGYRPAGGAAAAHRRAGGARVP